MSPRPLFGTQAGEVTKLDIGTRSPPARADAATRASVSLARRTPRYAALLAKLDTGHLQPADMTAVMDAIAQEFGPGAAQPLGLVSQCYLGPPYEVHILDLVGQIVEHFERGTSMPRYFERARKLASHPAYIAIEVYEDALACVRADGSITEVRS